MLVQDSKLVVIVSKAVRTQVCAQAKRDGVSVSKLVRAALQQYFGGGANDASRIQK